MKYLVFILILTGVFSAKAQFSPEVQNEMNRAFRKGFESLECNNPARIKQEQTSGIADYLKYKEHLLSNLDHFLPPSEVADVIDTIFVGDVPGDTLVITGNFTHQGPVFVFNDGVLIFDNATVTDSGDIYVFQNGQLIADSSSFTFPQEYFYQRGLIMVHNANVQITNCSFNFSGYSHSFVIGNNAQVYMENIHQNDWTTCGMYNTASLTLKNCNISGEYIISDTVNCSFINADTIILWHHIPDGGNVLIDFPEGDTIYNYVFNDTVPGINGLHYSVTADSCSFVSWALMPENGSDVTVQNSQIRLIGNWFRGGSTALIHGIFNNSSYVNYIAPLSDRNLHLINSDVQTWSMYVFDSAQVFIDSCQLGEVGCQQQSTCFGNSFLLDGSGGYYWATDSTVSFATNVMIYTTARSERNSIFGLAYSIQPFSAPSAVGKSLLVSVQNVLPSDPIAYDEAVVWNEFIDMPDTVISTGSIPVNGSCWIQGGPAGGWMTIDHYDLSYVAAGDSVWIPFATGQGNIFNGLLGTWNTGSITSGLYIIRLTGVNTFGDSVECMRSVFLDQQTGIGENESLFSVYPNPAANVLYIDFIDDTEGSIDLTDLTGRVIQSEKVKQNKFSKQQFNISCINEGVYLLRYYHQGKRTTHKIVIAR